MLQALRAMELSTRRYSGLLRWILGMVVVMMMAVAHQHPRIV